MILAHIPTLQGGAWNEFTVLKQNRITAIATENHLPLIALVQSVSNSFRYRDISMSSRHCVHTYVGFVPVNRLASSFPNSSAFSIRVARYFEISLFEQNMDYRVALWSLALLVKMATAEVAAAEDLGGAEMHATVTGLSDQLATDECVFLRPHSETFA